eukprot:TRINITY_DN5092_c0_g1_i2.p2 TRINITY_DN5092_c0_g1~~TRINITY_DN5092_c0_g1_i2.p2  ORF type:complete len:191 (-),score=30.42 TRINITY_DN5092_c0_g1_i2:828-1400(-)
MAIPKRVWRLLCVWGILLTAAAIGQIDGHIGEFDDNYPYGQWTRLDFADGGPPPRVFAASSTGSPLPPPYAPSDRTGIVIFGGSIDPTAYYPNYNDVWVFNPADDHNDGRTWTEVPLNPGSTKPEPRCLSAIAVAGTTLYMFGGYDGTNWYNDLWSLDLTVLRNPGHESTLWKFESNSGPPPMCGMTMVR